MSKILNDEETFRIFRDNDRINFVDKNNVLVGYAYEGYYFISPNVENEVFDIENTSQLILDPDLIKEIKIDAFIVKDGEMFSPYGYDEVSYVVFNLTNGKQLVLYNCHNGYYSHGFDVYREDKYIDSGRI